MRAGGQLRLYWSGNEDDRHVDVQLFAVRTGALRLQGRRALVGTIFDLASDGQTFRLSVPDHGTVYTGTSAAPAEPDPERPYLALRPHHITEALLPEPLPMPGGGAARLAVETYPDRYVVSWLDGNAAGEAVLRRRVEIERIGLRVRRIEAFDSGGRVDFIAGYRDYLGDATRAFPRTIEVTRPWEELTFRFDLEEVVAEPTIPAGAFTLTIPEGYRTLTVEEAMRELHGRDAAPRSAGAGEDRGRRSESPASS